MFNSPNIPYIVSPSHFERFERVFERVRSHDCNTTMFMLYQVHAVLYRERSE